MCRGPEKSHLNHLTAGAGLKVSIQIMPVYIRHWALDNQAYRHKHELGILSLRCIGANGSTITHTGTGSGGPGWAKSGDGAAYVVPKWVGRMASKA